MRAYWIKKLPALMLLASGILFLLAAIFLIAALIISYTYKTDTYTGMEWGRQILIAAFLIFTAIILLRWGRTMLKNIKLKNK